jgi:hypothetical protein
MNFWSLEESSTFPQLFSWKATCCGLLIRSALASDKGVQGIDLFLLSEPLTWVMLQACFGQIAIQAYATFLGKCFELRPGFIRTSEGVYSGWRSLGYLFFLHVNDY